LACRWSISLSESYPNSDETGSFLRFAKPTWRPKCSSKTWTSVQSHCYGIITTIRSKTPTSCNIASKAKLHSHSNRLIESAEWPAERTRHPLNSKSCPNGQLFYCAASKRNTARRISFADVLSMSPTCWGLSFASIVQIGWPGSIHSPSLGISATPV